MALAHARPVRAGVAVMRVRALQKKKEAVADYFVACVKALAWRSFSQIRFAVLLSQGWRW